MWNKEDTYSTSNTSSKIGIEEEPAVSWKGCCSFLGGWKKSEKLSMSDILGLTDHALQEAQWMFFRSKGGVNKNKIRDVQRFSADSVQFSHSVLSNSLWPQGLQHSKLPCPSLTPGACSNSFALSQWCHPAISASVIPFSSCLQSFQDHGLF